MKLREIKEKALDLLFPPKCVFCGALLGENEKEVCARCAAALPWRGPGEALTRAGEFDCAVTFYYGGPVVEGVHALKFQNKPGRATAFGRLLAQTAAEELGGRFDAVTFVPVSARRNFSRGYDQSRLLAESAAGVWGVKVEKILKKTRNNRPQSTVKSPEERRRNAEGAYAALRPERAAGRRFLLVDDVVTTGSTLSACARTLMAAGAASVVCAALAGGRPPEEDQA